MIGNEILLDTSIVIDLFKGKWPVFELIEKQQTVYIPTAVLAELYLGAYRSTNEQKHLQEIKKFLQMYCAECRSYNCRVLCRC